MSQRLAGVVLVLLLCLAAMAGPALAAEGAGDAGAGDAGAGAEGTEEAVEEPAPRSVEEVVADNDIARQFAPEPYEQPTWFPMLRLPLMIVGVLVTLAVLFAFLLWQPRFAKERQEKSRRR